MQYHVQLKKKGDGKGERNGENKVDGKSEVDSLLSFQKYLKQTAKIAGEGC